MITNKYFCSEFSWTSVGIWTKKFLLLASSHCAYYVKLMNLQNISGFFFISMLLKKLKISKCVESLQLMYCSHFLDERPPYVELST